MKHYNFLKKIAQTPSPADAAAVVAMGGTSASAPAPAAAPAAQGQPPKPVSKPAPKPQKTTVERATDWRSYVAFDAQYPPATRRPIYDIWKKITGGQGGKGFDDDFGGKYTYDYTSYVQWWKDNGRDKDPADILAKLNTLESELRAAGATGQQEPQLDTGKLLNYLTTPLRVGAATKRDETFKKFKADPAMRDYIKIYGGDRSYMHPDLATRVLNSGWVKTIDAEYNADTKENPMLELALTGLPPDALSGGAATSAGAPQQPVQQRPTSNLVQMIRTPDGQQAPVVSIGASGGDQIYLDTNTLKSGSVPVLYRLDGRTGKFAPLSPTESGQWRSRLTKREIDRMAMAVSRTGVVGPDRIEPFKQYMTQIRQNTGFPGFLRSMVGKKQNLPEAQASTRQSRLDNLKKKGVI